MSKSLAIKLRERITGNHMMRSLAWRAGRRLYTLARRESLNSPDVNGEYWLLDRAISLTTSARPVLVDVGANVGDWTARAASLVSSSEGRVHAFEPTPSTFQHLETRFAVTSQVTVHQTALSSLNGEADFFVVGDRAGTNSLQPIEGVDARRVEVRQFDDFVRSKALTRVLMVKTDTEGHDWMVMLGAKDSLSRGIVGLWQFEYNHRWIASSASLRNVFDFVRDKPYAVGRLYGRGIETYSEWHPELDRFFETNYVLVHADSEIRKLCSPMRFDTSNVAVPV